MNDLIHQLKKLKQIEPDAAYSHISRQLILDSPRPPKKSSVFHIIANSFQFGLTVALTGILLLVVLGGLGITKLLAPFELSSLDESNLRAEAKAIDIQIQLTDLNYTAPETAQSTPATVASVTHSIAPASKEEVQQKAEEFGIQAPASSSESIGIDEALDELTK